MALFIVPATPGFEASAQDVLHPSNQPGIQSTTYTPTANKDVRRLQRLLKLLANQNPARFRSVDPGVVDGKVGRGTVTAIRTFQRITGAPETGVITNELYRQILKAQSESPAPTEFPGQPKPTERAAVPEQPDSGTEHPTVAQRFAQLGSIKDENRIGREWARLQQANPEQLRGRTPIIETANLADRGTYYRILVGPFETFDRAKTFCTSLRKQRQSCLVKKRPVAQRLTNLQPAKNPAPTSAPPAPVASAKTEDKTDVNSEDKTDIPATVGKPGSIGARAANLPQAPAEITASDNSAEFSVPTGETGATPSSEPPSLALNTGAPDKPAGPMNPAGDNANEPATSTVVKTADTESRTRSQPKLAGNSPPKSPAVSGATSATADKADASNPAKAKPLTNAQPATALAQWLLRSDSDAAQSYLGPSVAAVAGTIFGLLILMWWQRHRRSLAFEAMLGSPLFEDPKHEHSVPGTPEQFEGLRQEEETPRNLLEELQSHFDSRDLLESRQVRDAFLNDIAELKEVAANAYSGEHAMLVNRKLNQLIRSDPDTYKAIFLNWLFLNHVADRISTSEYTMKRLDPRIQAEFQLLAGLFKIHLLELEARHHVRQRLPKLFAALHDF